MRYIRNYVVEKARVEYIPTLSTGWRQKHERSGWIVFGCGIEVGYFKTKEEAEMALLKIMLSDGKYNEIE